MCREGRCVGKGGVQGREVCWEGRTQNVIRFVGGKFSF